MEQYGSEGNEEDNGKWDHQRRHTCEDEVRNGKEEKRENEQSINYGQEKDGEVRKTELAVLNGKLYIDAVKKTGNLMALEVTIEGDNERENVVALIDTGACVSLIDAKLCKKLNVRINSEATTTLYAITDDKIPTQGEASVQMSIGGMKDEHSFVIVQGIELPTPVLLGADFLLNRNITLEVREDNQNTILTIDGVTVPIVGKETMREAVAVTKRNQPELPVDMTQSDRNVVVGEDSRDSDSENEGPRVRTVIREACRIPAATAGYVVLETSLTDVHEAMFEPCEGNSQARILYPGIVTLYPSRTQDENKTIFCIPYCNVELDSLELTLGASLGKLTPVEQVGYVNMEEEEEAEEDKTIIAAVRQRDRETKLNKLIKVVDELFSEGTEENQALKWLVTKYPDVFTTADDPLTVTPYFYHTIRQPVEEVVYKRPYPIPVKYHDEVSKQLKLLQEQGVIRPSKSPYNTPLVPVPKKDGGLRLCLDFRALNATIRDDKFPLPNIQSILQKLGKSSLFSCLDMRMGYHQVPLHPDSMEKTAFSSPEGHWEFTSLPFGLKDAPACFQRIVNAVLAGLTGHITHVYLDDIIVQGENLQDHVQNLDKVLTRLANAKLALKLEKCTFFKREVDYLGHVISSEGLKPQAQKVAAIKNVPLPKTIHDLQSFLGLVNYYRKFISDYAEICHPLTQMLAGQKRRAKKNDKTPVSWTEEAQNAFKVLKLKLAEEIPLAFPNFEKPFLLTTDASNISIGGVLQQEDKEGKIRPITFFSRTLNGPESRYSTIERGRL